jgi:hypothetical protein
LYRCIYIISSKKATFRSKVTFFHSPRSWSDMFQDILWPCVTPLQSLQTKDTEDITSTQPMHAPLSSLHQLEYYYTFQLPVQIRSSSSTVVASHTTTSAVAISSSPPSSDQFQLLIDLQLRHLLIKW